MTIDEAIESLRKSASESLDFKWQREQYQLAEWLEELVMLRLDSCMIHMSERLQLVENAYNKGIDDLSNACKSNTLCKTFGLRKCDIDKIAEELKLRRYKNEPRS